MVNMARSLDCGHVHSTMKKDGKAQDGLIALHGLSYCYQEYLHIYTWVERGTVRVSVLPKTTA